MGPVWSGVSPEIAFQLGGGVRRASLVRDDAVRARGDAKQRRRELRVRRGSLGARAVGQDVPERGGYRGVRRGGGGGAGCFPLLFAAAAAADSLRAPQSHERRRQPRADGTAHPALPRRSFHDDRRRLGRAKERREELTRRRGGHRETRPPRTRRRSGADPDAPAAARSRMRAQDSGAAATHCHAAFVAASPTPGSGAAARTAASRRGPREGSAHRRFVSARRVDWATRRLWAAGESPAPPRRRRASPPSAARRWCRRDPRRGEQPRCRSSRPVRIDRSRGRTRPARLEVFEVCRGDRAHERGDVRRGRRRRPRRGFRGRVRPREHLGRGSREARAPRCGVEGAERGGERGRPVVLASWSRWGFHSNRNSDRPKMLAATWRLRR